MFYTPKVFKEFDQVGCKSIVKGPTLVKHINDCYKEWKSEEDEFYVSLYRFKDLGGKTNLAQLPQDTLAYSDFLIFDFDNKNDLQAALDDTKDVLDNLNSNEIVAYPYYSGCKGFHIYVPTSQFGFVPTSDDGILKRMAERIAGDYASFDRSVYNKTRIFRAPNSRHGKTGRFKVFLDTMNSLEEITSLAANPSPFEEMIETEHPKVEILVDLYEEMKVPVLRTGVMIPKQDYGGSILTPASEGERNTKAFTVTMRLVKSGLPKADTMSVMLDVWNKLHCTPPLTVGEVTKVVESAYAQGRVEVITDHEDSAVMDIHKTLDAARTAYSKQGQDCFYSGYEFLDKYTLGFGPADVTFLAARSGLFKTTVLDNILQRGSHTMQKPVLFFSQEMSNQGLTLRRVQKAYGISKKEALLKLQSGEDLSEAAELWEYVKTCYSSNLDVDGMMRILDAYISKYGQLAAIGIDYLGLCRGCNNNRERTANMATMLKTRIAREANCHVFCLTQAKQVYEGRGGDIELDRTCVKDSDTVLDSGDFSIGMWGHWIESAGEEEKVIFGKFLKDRGTDPDAFGYDPYFMVDIDKRAMNALDIIHIPNPPKFNQRTKGGEE